MRKIKRCISVFLAVTLLLMTIFSTGITADAAADIGSAKSISVNSTYTGNIESGYGYEKDYYKFTLSSDGYVTVNFTNSSPSSSADEAWTISLLTNYGAETITSSNAKLNQSKVSLTAIGLSAGTYYVCVTSRAEYNSVSKNNYTINAGFTSADNWEKELNENSESANIINTNKTYYGTTRSGYDYEKDFYKFTVSNAGYVTVDFTNSNPVSASKNAWTVTLYGFKSDTLTEIISQTVSTSNSKISMTTVGIPAGTYYIRVQSYYYLQAVSNNKYALCVNYKADSNWEQEFNEDVSTANVIETNHTYYGTTRGSENYEKDFYKFEINSDGYVTVDFTNSSPTTSSGHAWVVSLYGFNTGELTQIVSKDIYTNNGKVSLQSIGLPKGIYYVCIQCGNQYYLVTSMYSVRVNYTQSNNWEKELNEDNTTATSIKLQEKYSGTLRSMYDDKDYYKFTTTAQGAINVTFFNDNPSTSQMDAWVMNVYDSSLKLLDSKTIKQCDETVTTQLTGKTAGIYYICVQSAYYGAISPNVYQIKVDCMDSADKIKPVCSISSTNNVASSQTVTLSLSDNVGVVSYYWGTSSSPSSSSYTSITSTKSTSVSKTVSGEGTYYLIVKDAAGNTNFISATFYKTTFNTNGGSVSPSYVITKSGNSFTVPTASKSNLNFSGWSLNNGGSVNYRTGATYTPGSNLNLYAVWETNSSAALGDVNGDNVIDAADAGIISRYDAGFITLTSAQLKAGDVNKDGTVDAADAGIISRYDAGFISSVG